jgi:hypothetical protein
MKNYIFGLAAIAIAFAASAFTTNLKTPTQYHYKSSSANITDMRNISNWEQVSGSTSPCASGDNVVCRITYDGNLAAFDSYLDTQSADDLLDQADATKD